jgi:hypothetical protein
LMSRSTHYTWGSRQLMLNRLSRWELGHPGWGGWVRGRVDAGGGVQKQAPLAVQQHV